jgi:DNA polymerase III subunit chi
MAEVWFYHIEQRSADDELPGLLQRGLERSLRMGVATTSDERVKELSGKLWGAGQTVFIPHGFDGEPFPEQQPIYISATGQFPNAARFCFYLDGALPNALDDMERASILFDGNDETAVQQARLQWRRFKGEGAVIRYWKKDENGRWTDQAVKAD